MNKFYFGLLRTAALLLVMQLPVAFASRLIAWRFPAVEQRSAGSLLTARDRNMRTFIDVRGMSLRQVQARIATCRRHHPQYRVVLVCEIGYCSSQMASALLHAGLQNVVNLEGGLRALRQTHAEIRDYAAHRAARPAPI